jgi:hypothetical protein
LIERLPQPSGEFRRHIENISEHMAAMGSADRTSVATELLPRPVLVKLDEDRATPIGEWDV